jgi:signal transduction histidine kinase
LIVGLPIDELVLARQSAAKAQEAAFHEQQLESLRTIANGAAHEINNPLAIVSAHLERIQRLSKQAESVPTESLNKSFPPMLQAISRIIYVIHALQTLSISPADQTKGNEDLNALLDILHESMSGKMSGLNVRFTMNRAAEGPQAKMRSQEILQALTVLVTNALDAVETQSDKEISVLVKTDSEFVEILVSDNGPGIDSAIANRIMDRFFSGKSSGAGLGLSLAKAIAEQHRGNLTLVSLKGPTTFSLKIPATLAPENTAHAD